MWSRSAERRHIDVIEKELLQLQETVGIDCCCHLDGLAERGIVDAEDNQRPTA